MVHLIPWTSTEVQKKGYVLHLFCLQGVVLGMWVVVGCMLDRTRMSRIFVSFFICDRWWLKIFATSALAFSDSFFRMILYTHIVEGWYRRLKISLSSASVTRIDCNICLTKSRVLFIMFLG